MSCIYGISHAGHGVLLFLYIAGFDLLMLRIFTSNSWVILIGIFPLYSFCLVLVSKNFIKVKLASWNEEGSVISSLYSER